MTARLRKLGIMTYIVSGDHEYPIRALAEQLHGYSEKKLIITTVPAVICINGVFAFHFGIYTSMLLFFSGL